MVEFLASLPTSEAIIAIVHLKLCKLRLVILEKNRTVGLTAEDEKIWQGYQYLEYIVRMTKARAF